MLGINETYCSITNLTQLHADSAVLEGEMVRGAVVLRRVQRRCSRLLRKCRAIRDPTDVIVEDGQIVTRPWLLPAGLRSKLCGIPRDLLI